MAKDDAAWAKLHVRTAESVESKLKKKAEIYDKLQRGRTGGLNEAQLDNLLVDVRLFVSVRVFGTENCFSLTLKMQWKIALKRNLLMNP